MLISIAAAETRLRRLNHASHPSWIWRGGYPIGRASDPGATFVVSELRIALWRMVLLVMGLEAELAVSLLSREQVFVSLGRAPMRQTD